MSQETVLKCLEEAKEPIPSKELSLKLGLTTSTITSTIKKLMAQGYVRRIFTPPNSITYELIKTLEEE
jgi:DNA-binding MarR family transcriptional regulator